MSDCLGIVFVDVTDRCFLDFFFLAFSDDIAEEEDELVESAKADEARFRAFRCFFVIETLSAGQKVNVVSVV